MGNLSVPKAVLSEEWEDHGQPALPLVAGCQSPTHLLVGDMNSPLHVWEAPLAPIFTLIPVAASVCLELFPGHTGVDYQTLPTEEWCIPSTGTHTQV